jgi:hypothetical protein
MFDHGKDYQSELITVSYPDLGLTFINADSKMLIQAYKIARDFGTVEQMSMIIQLYNNMHYVLKTKKFNQFAPRKKLEMQLTLTIEGKE